MILHFHDSIVSIHVHQHGVDGAVLLERLEQMDAKIAEVLQASKDALAGAVATRDAVALIGPEIDKIEAAITDLKSKTNLSAEDSAALDEVIGNARAVVSAAADTTTAAGAAASDAADGIDEAVNTGGGTPTP